MSLQQYLPFTVLKLEIGAGTNRMAVLQQYLPFTVLKLIKSIAITYLSFKVATVPTVYGIETRRWNV